MFQHRFWPVAILLLGFAGCARPPATAYDNGTGQSSAAAALAVGQNTAGEACTSQKAAGGADVYCGNWDQPSAHVQNGGPAGGASLAALATSSAWRASLEGGYSCGAPAAGVILDNVPAEILSCTQRFGGWPHVALVSGIGGDVYYGDGVLPALPALQRAIGVASGRIRAADASTASVAGVGDFRPVTLAQAQATYNPATCKDSAGEFAALPRLPYAKLELAAASAVFGATPDDELLGPDFTVPNVEAADLKNYCILHFAAHALLPTDRPCQNAPAIATSAPPDAASAQQALLDTGDVTNLKLDANLVVLSACNTGGGASGGEALSGLARSFFYAGARALMVTQWSVNDQVSAYLVAETLSRFHAGANGGATGSLRAAQLALIDNAGKTMPAEVANPFFWAAFAVIGDGGGAATMRLSALSGGPNPRL